MTSSVEISIPNTSIISNTSKPYTVYNISLRLPLRSFTLQKRFSEFTTFHSSITSEAGAAPPSPLPAKSWFTRTVSNPDLTEHRRQGLETYLQAINTSEDQRWRNTTAWKSFLNLPSNATSRYSASAELHSALVGPRGKGAPTTDPVVWLDQYRELKSQLHDARLALTRRDQATTAQSQHENAAAAKKCLVKAGTTIAALDKGLQNLGGDSWSGGKLGEGEMARRRDMVKNARREREGLENLLNAMVAKSKVDETVANAPEKDKAKLFGGGGGPKPSGRVLGRETDRTRALDNRGVVSLQQQIMQEQDEDVMALAKAVARQKELGLAIHQELAEQQELLDALDEDVDRVQAKLHVAGNRIKKIS